ATDVDKSLRLKLIDICACLNCACLELSKSSSSLRIILQYDLLLKYFYTQFILDNIDQLPWLKQMSTNIIMNSSFSSFISEKYLSQISLAEIKMDNSNKLIYNDIIKSVQQRPQQQQQQRSM
ncbi:unnamed protein product, partial [Didymodactylos carnosus]